MCTEMLRLFKRPKSQEEIPNVIGLHILIYSKHKGGTDTALPETKSCTAEEICDNLADQLHISPTFLHCFGLYVKEQNIGDSYWIAPADVVTDSVQSKSEIHFRMRFLPEKDKVHDLFLADEDCTKYLFYQVKWDFIHGQLSNVDAKDREKEVRGLTVILILIMFLIETQGEGQQFDSVKQFLQSYPIKSFFPPMLQNKIMLDKSIMKDSMIKHVEDYRESYPNNTPRGSYSFFMKSFLELKIKENNAYRIEEYRATDEKSVPLSVRVEIMGKRSRLKIGRSMNQVSSALLKRC